MPSGQMLCPAVLRVLRKGEPGQVHFLHLLVRSLTEDVQIFSASPLGELSFRL